MICDFWPHIADKSSELSSEPHWTEIDAIEILIHNVSGAHL